MNKIIVGLIAIVIVGMAACAIQGEGQLEPLILKNFPVLAIDAQVYYNQATQSCDAGAAANYRSGMFLCANPQSTVDLLPSLGWGTTTAEEAAVLNFICNRGGFIISPTLPSVIQVANCPVTKTTLIK